jgi:hypothetical protein
MMLCNSSAGLILSTGAGSEMQFSMAGLHSEQDPNYHRVFFIYFLIFKILIRNYWVIQHSPSTLNK